MAGILYWKISPVVMVITSEILNLSRVADRPRVIIEIHQQVLRKSQTFKLGHAEEAFKDGSHN